MNLYVFIRFVKFDARRCQSFRHAVRGRLDWIVLEPFARGGLENDITAPYVRVEYVMFSEMTLEEFDLEG